MGVATSENRKTDIAGLLKALGPAPFPQNAQPMLATLVDEPFDDPDWTFEPKLDGLRVLCYARSAASIRLVSRRGNDQAFQFPEIVQGFSRSIKRPMLIDGEIVSLDARGYSSFRLLQQRFHVTDAQTVVQRQRAYPAYLYVFDVLYFDRYDVTPLPLRDRRRILQQALKWSDRIRLTDSTPGQGIKLYRAMCRAAQEGIIAKRLGSPYVAGRSHDWVKIKCLGRQEFVIGGFTDPQRSRIGLGALLVGYYDDDGKFTYAGKVGTGFTHDLLLDLRKRLAKLEKTESPFARGKPPRAGVHWVKPRLVAEIAFAEWTQNDMLRQPRFEGLRMDKKPKDVKLERAKPTTREVHPKRTAKKNTTSRKTAATPAVRRRSSESEIPLPGLSKLPEGLHFTNLDKVMFPEKGYTKGEILRYYLSVARLLIPHLKDRPVTLERLPDGVAEGAPRFWQKNTPPYYPKWIPRVNFPNDDGKPVNYALVNDEAVLLYLVNQGAITFHTWSSRVQDPDRPDYVIFDLDPGEASFSNIVKIAKQVREELEGPEKTKAFIKTSGKTGLHVMTAWKSRGGYDEARAWAIGVAQRVVAKLPDIATMERMKDKRRGRAYVDVMQNGRGKHVVPPYVLRATPHAGASTPLDWKDVTARLDPAKFDLESALKRFAKLTKDPLAALLP